MVIFAVVPEIAVAFELEECDSTYDLKIGFEVISLIDMRSFSLNAMQFYMKTLSYVGTCGVSGNVSGVEVIFATKSTRLIAGHGVRP